MKRFLTMIGQLQCSLQTKQSAEICNYSAKIRYHSPEMRNHGANICNHQEPIKFEVYKRK